MRNHLLPISFFLVLMLGFSFAYNASGGTKTVDGLYTVHTFTSSGTFAINGTINATVLIVAGGGSGSPGGGGGAGGLIYNDSYNATGNITVTVGNGASAPCAVTCTGNNGQNSTFGILTAIGGGGGGLNDLLNDAHAGGSGGGGGSASTGTTNGGAGTAGQGNKGGGNNGYTGSPYPGGGGGGAGTLGYNASGATVAGNGGGGANYSINGSTVCYAGGGAGASYITGNTNGVATCGGGNGGPNGVAGTANTGGGGGAGEGAGAGGAGGSGIVIVRYLTVENTTSTNTLSINLLTPTNALITANKTQNFSYSINSSMLATPVNVLLYLDGSLIANDTATTNATLSNLYTTTHGLHSWYVFTYNSTNYSMSAISSNYTFEVNFSVSGIGPANGTIIQGNTTTLYYSTQNFYPINCTTYLDGTSADYRVLASSSSLAIVTGAASGTHTWYASCVAGDNPAYVKNTSLLIFSMNFASYNTTLNLTSAPENVLTSPQAMFYDINGSLNVLYFTDDGASRTLRVKTIEGNAVTCAANATMQPTSAFMLALREVNKTVLLSFNSSDSTQVKLANFSSCSLALDTGSFPYSTAGTNSNYDPYTYAYTKQYPTLSLTNASYYLFTVPLPNGTGLFQKNIGSNTLTQVGAQFPSSFAPAWQTIANSSNLSGWYYLEPAASGTISLGYYDGASRTVLETLDASTHTAGQLNASFGGFESYGGKTYAILANLGNTTIHLIENNYTLTINESIAQPSHFFFVDEYTFLFFNTIGSTTNAYSCYFATAGNCTKFTASEYGIAMPYERGSMATAKRDGSSDVVAKGQITSGAVVQLLYNLNAYDAKYRCYNEMNEVRKLFQVQILTNSSANTLQNSSWGYVIPSANLGAGLKKSFFTCANATGDLQPQRMFLSGLTGNFTINAYSLNTGLGAYYTITVVDEFGAPVPGAKVSAYRFSPLNNAFVVIEQGITDSTGSAVLYLQPFTLYRLTIEQAGYVTLNFDFTPTAVTTVNIRLSSSTSPLTLPNFYYLWDDISYSLTPSTSFSTNATNITYQVSSNSSGLEYYGLEVIRTFPNGTKTTVYSNNVSGQPSGGILTYPITTQGSYSINPYFKLQNFSQYEPLTKIFKYQNVTMGFIQARDLFNQTQPITGWVFYLIAVVVAMLAVGFASKYTGDGAGLVGLAVLWGFSLFNPAVEIVCVAGLAGTCITPVIATAFATIATIAALYAKQYL